MDRKRADRIQSLNDIVETINRMAGDDEILTKIALKFISSLKVSLQNGGPFDIYFDSSNIATNFWPYGQPPEILPQNLDEKNDNSTNLEMVPHTPTRRSITEDTAPILHKIQQEMGMKLRQQDLIAIGKKISVSLQIPLKKKERQSKVGILEWMQANWETIEPTISETVLEYRNSLEKNDA